MTGMKIHRKIRYNKFTLVELMIAMSVLSLIILMMLYVFRSTQKNWQWHINRTKVYQNSRIAFDILEIDLKGLVTSKIEDQTIAFHLYNHDAKTLDTSEVITFVSLAEPDDSMKTEFSEITYSFHTDPDYPSSQYVLRRQQVYENDALNWNFYNNPTDWYLNDTSTYPYYPLVYGVWSFSVSAVNSELNTLTEGATYTDMPVRIQVQITLFDDRFSSQFQAESRQQSIRSFNKIIYYSKSFQ
ncbi:MAG: hypothetical protein MK193_10645 [Lentisphaeria bacterium]|nr:hypothetical protein [Lentisphaeria bacterium]